jgi:hypothetical protein
MNLFDKYKDKQNVLTIDKIVDSKIILCVSTDIVLYWVYYLSPNSDIVSVSNNYIVFRLNDGEYIVQITNSNENTVMNIVNLLTEKNYVHFVLCDFDKVNHYITKFESEDIKNFNYSLVNYMSETVYDTEPRPLDKLNKIKYYFTSTNVLARSGNQNVISDFQTNMGNRFILDFRYSLTYFYTKLGFNYFQKGNHLFTNSNRLNKVFLYSKSINSTRDKSIKEAIETGKIFEKTYSDEDWFWYFNNYNQYHTPFIVDYNSCKFNLVMETQLQESNGQLVGLFFSEKTIKTFLVPTPSYVLLQEEVYKQLISNGFYFLNVEFNNNYKDFCDFLKNSGDKDMGELFELTYHKSKSNKLRLEEYIYSLKQREINLLFSK